MVEFCVFDMLVMLVGDNGVMKVMIVWELLFYVFIEKDL